MDDEIYNYVHFFGDMALYDLSYQIAVNIRQLNLHKKIIIIAFINEFFNEIAIIRENEYGRYFSI
jgi:hypothetical protein